MTRLLRLVARIPPRTALASSGRRLLHASPALDPTPTMATPPMRTQPDAQKEQAVGVFPPDAFVHVQLKYLHESTADRVEVPSTDDSQAVLDLIAKSPKEAAEATATEEGESSETAPAAEEILAPLAEPQYVPLSSHVFGITPRRDILHSAVVWYLDGLRRGTASTKTRSDVAFSTRKIMPQKGSGKARRGGRGSPIFRKGGVVFGPHPRDFSTKLNRRVRDLALRSALSLRWKTGELIIVKNLLWFPPRGSTGPLRNLLDERRWNNALFLTAPRNPQPAQSLGRTQKTSAAELIYTAEQEEEHWRAVRNFEIALKNIPRTQLIMLNNLSRDAQAKAKGNSDIRKKPGDLPAYLVMARKTLVCDLGAIEWLEEKLGGAIWHAATQQAVDMADLAAETGEAGDQLSGTNLLASAMGDLNVADGNLSAEEAQAHAEENEEIQEIAESLMDGVPDDKDLLSSKRG